MTTETSMEEAITVCTACEGFGWSLWDGLPCKSCGGTGNLELQPRRPVPGLPVD